MIIILAILFFIWMIVSVFMFIHCIQDSSDDYGSGVAIFMFVVATLLTVGTIFEIGYKTGQIDAINHKIKYELKQSENGSSSWEPITK